ncbi:hypothetical protein AB4X15_08185 [Peribacillus simplex]|uniref:sunset domain-containing protein n=1 Tax=Peribacillus simplex TaxID=1478 RepID=UPI0034E8CCE6
MSGFLLLGLLAVIYALKNLLGFHTFQRINQSDKPISMKIFFISLSVAFALLISGCIPNNTDTVTQSNVKNEQLTSQVKTLTSQKIELQEKYDQLKKQVDTLSVNIESLEEEKKELESKNSTLTQANDSLIKENETLQIANEKIENELDYITNSSTKGETTGTLDETYSPPTDEAASEYTESYESCEIKGSVNGIYHTPGSTYYSRTTNVVEWFCTTEEAEEAGYRPPLR